MEKNYMNPNTGSVDTLDGWGFDIERSKSEGLIEVVKNTDGDWIEAV